MRSLLQYYRAGNMVISGIATLLGFWIGGISPLAREPWLPVLAMMLLTAFANAHNDLVDYEVDRINRPSRPLPSGRLTLTAGIVLAWGSLAAALLLGLAVSWLHFCFFSVIAIWLWIYNRILKGQPLVGNFCVAVLTVTPMVVAVSVTGWKNALWPPMLFAFLLSFAREIIKDVEDMPGDRALGLRTFPILRGIRASCTLTFVLLGLTLLALPAPVLLHTYPWPFLLLCALLVLPPVVLAMRQLYLQRWRSAQGLVKIAMLGGIISALGALYL